MSRRRNESTDSWSSEWCRHRVTRSCSCDGEATRAVAYCFCGWDDEVTACSWSYKGGWGWHRPADTCWTNSWVIYCAGSCTHILNSTLCRIGSQCRRYAVIFPFTDDQSCCNVEDCLKLTQMNVISASQEVTETRSNFSSTISDRLSVSYRIPNLSISHKLLCPAPRGHLAMMLSDVCRVHRE